MKRVLVLALLVFAPACGSEESTPTAPGVNGVYQSTGSGPIERLELADGSYSMTTHDGTTGGHYSLDADMTRLNLVDTAGNAKSYAFKVLKVGTPPQTTKGSSLTTRDLVDNGGSPVSPGGAPTEQGETPVTNGDSPVSGQSEVLSCQANCALTTEVDGQILENSGALLSN